MIEESALTALHRHEMLLGEVIAYAFPNCAFGARLNLILPGPSPRFALQKPVSHSLVDRAAYDPTPAATFDRAEPTGLTGPSATAVPRPRSPASITRFEPTNGTSSSDRYDPQDFMESTFE